jgi:hypothetical protein
MIEQPVQFESLSAKSLIGDTFNSSNTNINSATINNLRVNTVSAANLFVRNLTADYYVQTVNTNVTLTTADNSKAFHFDTSVGPLSASFSSSLPIGFNVSLYNVGNFSIGLSSNGILNTPGNSKVNSTKYTGMFIYKAASPDGIPPEGVFYGVGIFQ